ncbi:hypothetical protein D3C74_55320 [compost metagenome]
MVNVKVTYDVFMEGAFLRTNETIVFIDEMSMKTAVQQAQEFLDLLPRLGGISIKVKDVEAVESDEEREARLENLMAEFNKTLPEGLKASFVGEGEIQLSVIEWEHLPKDLNGLQAGVFKTDGFGTTTPQSTPEWLGATTGRIESSQSDVEQADQEWLKDLEGAYEKDTVVTDNWPFWPKGTDSEPESNK